jgi:hypothetical protein
MNALIDRSIGRLGVTHRTQMTPMSIEWGSQIHAHPVAQRIAQEYKTTELLINDHRQLNFLAGDN